MPPAKDPTEPIRLRASRYPDVDQGTSCTQSAFRTGGKAFLFLGEQGGRYKAMFKLRDSLPEARRLAKQSPADFQVGSWVTARFDAARPLPAGLWQRWLDESHALSRPAAKKKPARKKAAAGPARRKAAKEGAARKKVAKKKASATRGTRSRRPR